MRFPLVLAVAAVTALVLAAILWPGNSGDLAVPGPIEPANGVASATDPLPSDDPRLAVPTADVGEIDPQLALVRVHCRSEQDEPLAGCKVKIGEADAKLSGDDGVAEIGLPPGRQWLDVQPPDSTRVPLRQRVTAIGGRRVQVVATLPLRVVPDFWCRVVTTAGQPIAGAHLSAQPSGDGESVTGADGIVQVPTGGDAEFVRVAAPGFGPRRVVPTVGHASAATAMEVQLEPAAELDLTVVDAQDRPVGMIDVGITVMAWSLRWPATAPVRGGPDLWTGQLDEDGKCLVGDLPARCPVFVTVTPPAGTAAPGTVRWELEPGRNVRRLQLQPLGELHGRVLDAGGRPVAAAHVVAVQAASDTAIDLLPEGVVGESVMTGEDGSWQLGSLAPGFWLVGLQHTEGWSAACRRVELLPGGVLQVDVRAEPALSIRGRLLGPGNEPISAFEVHALRGGRVVGSAITERDGSYEILSLPAGEYEVFTELYQSELAMAAPIKVSAGRANVDIKVVSVLGTLRGHVVVPEGRGGDLWLRGLRRDGAEFCGGRCDIDGRFEQLRLREGLWDLSVTDARGFVGVLHGVKVVAGRTTPDLEIAMRPGAVLRPMHASADAFRIESGADVVARDALERGLPAEAHVPPGTFTVVFSRAGFELARREVTVAAGEQLLVRVD